MNMGPVEVLRRTHQVFRSCPDEFFPMYLLGAAVPAIAQLVTVAGLVGSYGYLSVTGRLDRFLAQLAETDIGPPPDPNSPAFTAWANDLFPLLDILFPRIILISLLVTIVVAIAVAFVLLAGVTAGQLSVCLFRLQNRPGLRPGLMKARKHWQSFLWLYLLEGVIWLGSSIIVMGLLLFTSQVSSILSGAVAFIAVPIWLLLVIGTRAVFVFAPVAVIVDDKPAIAAIKQGMLFLRNHPIDAVFYFIFAITVLFLYTGFFGVFSSIGAGSLIALGGLLIVSPALDLYKTAVFASSREPLPPTSNLSQSIREQLVHGLIRGWEALRVFIRASPVYLFFAMLFLVIGVASGLRVADPFTPFISVSIEGRIEGLFPISAAVEFFANNWSVAFTIAYAGIFIGIPSIVLLWINGMSLGVLYQLETNKSALIGFVLPHGIIEIPAIVIAGATGLFLGVQSWRAWNSDRSTALLASALQRVFWVVVGLGMVLALAGIIEGFISSVIVERVILT